MWLYSMIVQNVALVYCYVLDIVAFNRSVVHLCLHNNSGPWGWPKRFTVKMLYYLVSWSLKDHILNYSQYVQIFKQQQALSFNHYFWKFCLGWWPLLLAGLLTLQVIRILSSKESMNRWHAFKLVSFIAYSLPFRSYHILFQ